MNKIQIIGRLTANPELRATGNGLQVCSFTVAVSRRFNREETDFFSVTVWRDAAVNCNKYLAKGSQVGVSGELHLKHYHDKDGNKRFTIEIQADEVEFLSSKQNENNPSMAKPTPRQTKIEELDEVEDDDMPF